MESPNPFIIYYYPRQFLFNKTQSFGCLCVSPLGVCGCVSPFGVFVMSLFSHDWVDFVLDQLKTSLLIFLVIYKNCIESETVVIIARAHLSQSKIVHHLRVYTFGMSIASIRHVDSLGCLRQVYSWYPACR